MYINQYNNKRSRENIKNVVFTFGYTNKKQFIGRPPDSCSKATRSRPAPLRPVPRWRTPSGGDGAGRARPRTFCGRSPTVRRPSPSAPPCAPDGRPGRTGAAVPRTATHRMRTPTGPACRRPTERNRPPRVARPRPRSTAAAAEGAAGSGSPTCRRRPRRGRSPAPGRRRNRNRPRNPWVPSEPPACATVAAAVAGPRPLPLQLRRYR